MAAFLLEKEALRWDHLRSLEFLNCVVSVLSSSPLMGETQTAELKAALTLLQTMEPQEGLCVIERFLQEPHPFFKLLLVRYGDLGLEINLLNHSMRPLLASLLVQMGTWGQALADKMKLVFNRLIVIYDNQNPMKTCLYSQWLLDLNSALQSVSQDLVNVYEKTFIFSPNILANLDEDKDDKIDMEILTSLGFTHLSSHFFMPYTFALTYEKMGSSLVSLACIIHDFIKKMQESFYPHAHLGSLLLGWEKLRIQGKPLNTLYEFTGSSSLNLLDAKRQLLLSWVFRFHSMLRDSIPILDELILKTSKIQIASSHFHVTPLSSEINQRLLYELLFSGHDLASSHKALEDVHRYCAKKELPYDQLSLPEFLSINPHWSEKSFEIFQKCLHIEEGSLYMQNQKKNIYERLQSLLHYFEQLKTLIPLASLTACGLKTPLSGVSGDLRPELPIIENFDYPSNLEAPPPETSQVGDNSKQKSLPHTSPSKVIEVKK
ncbi:MAG: hypothetical protein KA436_02075 [Oligoflexales bacterium]|nr:hypothetical protein [Oligoflexales bacterium]